MDQTQILVVEDSPTQAYDLKMILETAIFQITIATNGKDALKALANKHFDLILTDIIMPEMSGYELCRLIKNDPKTSDIPVILLTTLREEQDIIQGIECGADNFIIKPYEAQYLLARIAQVLNSTKKRPADGEHVELELMGRSLVVNQNTAQVLGFLVSGFEEYLRAKRDEDEPANSLDSTSALAQKAFELSRSQTNLRRQTAILQLILGSMVEAVVVTDEKSELITLNKAAEEIFGYTTNNQPSKLIDLAEFYMPDQITPILEENHPFKRAISGEIVNDVELYLRNSASRSYWLSCNMRPLIDESGLSKGVVAVFRDVTARKDMEQQVRHFYSMITHELRTPLTAIKGSLRLIEGGLAGPISEKAVNLVKIAVSESDRLIALINEILDVTKIESGKIDVVIEKLSPQELLTDTIKSMKTLADTAEIKLITDLEALDPILGDRGRVMQVLTNLIGNALKFSPKGSSIKLRTLPGTNDCLRFEVVDQGSGIPRDKVGLLFQAFQQLSTSASGGTGLGLHTCKLLVELQGGTIGAESTVGQGSLFWFELPLAGAYSNTLAAK